MPSAAGQGEDFRKALWRDVQQARLAAGDTLPRAAAVADAAVGGTPLSKAMVSIVKADEELRTVWGWASVVEVDGELVVDRQGDIILEADLLKAAHGFNGVRTIKAMHAGEKVGEVVESVVFTRELQKSLGIDLGLVGWMIAARIDQPAAWADVKAGRMPAFSIGGRGERIDHE